MTIYWAYAVSGVGKIRVVEASCRHDALSIASKELGPDELIAWLCPTTAATASKIREANKDSGGLDPLLRF